MDSPDHTATNMMPNVLIIEADPVFRLKIAQHLRLASFEVFEAEQRTDAMRYLATHNFDVVLLGMEGLKREGISLLGTIKRIHPTTEVITVNGPKHMDLSIEAMKLGAFDDFLIPFELESLMTSVRRACSKVHCKKT